MTHHSVVAACCLAVTLGAAGCSGTETLVAAEADALLGAQCSYGGFKDAADVCFTTFDGCVAAEGADVEACKAELKACLPPPPEGKGPPRDGKGPHPGDHACDGGHPGGKGGPPPKGPPPDGLNDDGTHPPDHHGHPGSGRPPPLPEKAAIEACRAAFDACLTQTPGDSQACRDAEKTCVGEAFQAAFEARCAEAAAACSEPDALAEKCEQIATRCAEGIKGPPGGAVCE